MGLGGWVSVTRTETGVALDVVTAHPATAEEVVVTGTVEVMVKEPKQITGLARMAAMLAEKTTPDWATMLHSEFPIAPTWRANCQGERPRQICKGATQAVIG
jgi:hypothetical protein